MPKGIYYILVKNHNFNLLWELWELVSLFGVALGSGTGAVNNVHDNAHSLKKELMEA